MNTFIYQIRSEEEVWIEINHKLSYKDFMQNYGKNLQGHEDEGIRWFSADDSYYGRVVAEQTGKVLLGILGAPDVELVNDYLHQMRQKLFSMGRI